MRPVQARSDYKQIRLVVFPSRNGVTYAVIARRVVGRTRSDVALRKGYIEGAVDVSTVEGILHALAVSLHKAQQG